MSAACSSVKATQSNGALNFINASETQWRDVPKKKIKYAKKEDTVMLVGGLTILQDKLMQTAMQSIGENYVALPNPTFASFQTGKAFGNRGQCNPTYFTVGNLVKYLRDLRDEKGMTSEEIVAKHVFVTAGGCGPCRFGMYITEYKKALRDAGFDGFRITSFEHEKGIFQGDPELDAEDNITNFTPKFFITLVKAVLIGDVMNILGYKMRPYEVEAGSVDIAMEECRELVSEAFMKHTSYTKALWKCRKILEKVELNRLQPKAKVMIMGEFWAAMTEGDGNYNLHRFLEAEGAECIPQPTLNRLMLSLWEAEYKSGSKENLAIANGKTVDFSSAKTKIMIKSARALVKGHFYAYAKAIGLHDYEVPDMFKLEKLAKDYYTLECEGGEGHLEVAHLIESVKDNVSHLTISVKPFGCMPSSGVSDGVQSLVTNRFPEANFLAIETSGEGAANFYSRVQMALFKAKQSAKEEFEALTMPKEVPAKANNYLYQPHNNRAGTAATILASL